jgi:hypothetical protein
MLPFYFKKNMEESLYLAEVKLLTRYCHNCLDNKMKERIMMFLFKKELYDNATKLGLTEDADMYYKEMLNLLGMRTCNCTINCNTCKNCSNGSCTICK